MSSAVEKLTFSVLLLDKLSQPSKGVCKSMQNMQEMSRAGWQSIGKGAAVVTAAALTLNSLTASGREFNRALGEVESLGVAQYELAKLGAAGKKYTMQFGGNAAEIVRSGYDIQSAIPGLAKGALAEFTYQGALLAKAGKSNAATITSYTGTMYNIFEKDAKRIGQAKWVEQLTGKTAQAIKVFKTTGDNMSAAFTNLGSTGQTYGVSMDEQMAVLGTLQGTMGGANAGTAYKSFLNKVGQAQKVLGTKFSDSSGKMLPMVDILKKIRGKVGDGAISTANATQLIQAFGEEGGKAVMNLLEKTDSLTKSIDDLSNINDATNAVKMAEAMTDPLDRFLGTISVIRTTLGQALLPALNAVLSVIGRVLVVLQWLLDNMPPLRWLFAAAALAIGAMTMAWGGFMMLSGVTKLIRATHNELRILWAWCLKNSAATHSMTIAQRINAVAAMLWGKALGAMTIFTKLAAVGQWLLNASMYGCPIVWIIAGFMALIGVVILTIKYWDEICAFVWKYADYLLMLLGPIGWVIAAFKNWDKIVGVLRTLWGWFKKAFPNIANLIEKVVAIAWAGIKGVFDYWKSVFVGIYNFVGGILRGIGDFFVSMWGKIVNSGAVFYDWLSDKLVPLVQFFSGIFEGIGNIVSVVWDGIKSALTGLDGWLGSILRKISKIPGMGWLNPDVSADEVKSVPDAVAKMSETVPKSAPGIVPDAIAPKENIPAMGKMPGPGPMPVDPAALKAAPDDAKMTINVKVPELPAINMRDNQPVLPEVTESRRQSRDIPAGGIRNQSTNNTVNYGGITINTSAPMGPGMLEDWTVLAGGV